MGRKQQNEWHSLSGDCRGGNKSGVGKNATNRRALTSWKLQREGLVRAWKESNGVKGTHTLETDMSCVRNESNRVRGTDWRPSWRLRREKHIRTQNDKSNMRGTHWKW